MSDDRDPALMTDAELEQAMADLPWPLDGIVTFDDEPTIERANDLMREEDNRKNAREMHAKGLWPQGFWWPQ